MKASGLTALAALNPFAAIAVGGVILAKGVPSASLGSLSAPANIQNLASIVGGNTGALTTQFYSAFPGLRGIGNKTILNHLYLYNPDTMTFDYNNEWKTISLREQFGLVAIAGQAAVDAAGGHAVQTNKVQQRLSGLAGAFDAAGIKSMLETGSALLELSLSIR